MSEETEHTMKVTWAPTGQGEPLQAALWPQRRGPGSPPQGSRNRHLSRDEGPPARHHLPHDRPTHLQTRGRQSKARSRNDTYVGRPPPRVPDRRSSSSTPTPRHTLALASGFMFSDAGVEILRSDVRAQWLTCASQLVLAVHEL